MSIVRNNTPKDTLINAIVDLEWNMFQETQNIGGRAGCQDDRETFYIMRYSQFSVLNEDTLQSYRNDLESARQSGRNLITEKYGYMMEFTSPEYYKEKLEGVLPALSAGKAELIAQIVSLQLAYHKAFAEKYPRMAGAGRPEQDSYDTSVRTYSIGELKTYSEKTLQLFLRDVWGNQHMILDIQKTMAGFYGYSSLQAAEDALARRG